MSVAQCTVLNSEYEYYWHQTLQGPSILENINGLTSLYSIGKLVLCHAEVGPIPERMISFMVSEVHLSK